MLPATIQTWTYTGRLQLKHRRSQRKQNIRYLLRTRKYFTTGHMHIYSIPPMSRKNCKPKIVPKLCSDFIRVFTQISVATTFFGNHNQLSNFLNSNTVLNYQIEERSIDVNKFELGQSARGWRMVRVSGLGPITQNHFN